MLIVRKNTGPPLLIRFTGSPSLVPHTTPSLCWSSYWTPFTGLALLAPPPPPHSGRSPTGPAPTGPLFTLPLHRPRLVDAPTPLTGPPLVFFLSGLPFSGPTSSIPLFTGPFLAVSPSVHPPPPQ